MYCGTEEHFSLANGGFWLFLFSSFSWQADFSVSVCYILSLFILYRLSCFPCLMDNETANRHRQSYFIVPCSCVRQGSFRAKRLPKFSHAGGAGGSQCCVGMWGKCVCVVGDGVCVSPGGKFSSQPVSSTQPVDMATQARSAWRLSVSKVMWPSGIWREVVERKPALITLKVALCSQGKKRIQQMEKWFDFIFRLQGRNDVVTSCYLWHHDHTCACRL